MPDKIKSNNPRELRMRLRVWIRNFLKPLRQKWNELEVYLLMILAFTAIVVGFVGYRYMSSSLSTGNLLDQLYGVVRMFWLSVPSPVAENDLIQLARWLAFIVGFYVLLKVVITSFSGQIRLLSLQLFGRDHVIICGLGQKGMIMAEKFYNDGYVVVGIDAAISKDTRQKCAGIGILTIKGDATDEKVLLKAKVDRAKYLITVMRDDGDNALVAFKAKTLKPAKQKKALRCLVHMGDLDLWNMGRVYYESGLKVTDRFRSEFFNIYNTAARIVLDREPPYLPDNDGDEHVIVVGTGRMGKSILAQLARNWAILYRKTGTLRILIVGDDADAARNTFIVENPYFSKYVIVDTKKAKPSPGLFMGEGSPISGDSTITKVYACIDESEANLSTAIAIERALKSKVRVVACMSHEFGFAGMIKAMKTGATMVDNLVIYELSDIIDDPMRVLDHTDREHMACSIHQNYIEMQKSLGHTKEDNPSMAEWDELPEDLRESNRSQADDMDNKAEAINSDIVPLESSHATFTFTPGEIEKLAEIEHLRWNRERAGRGWKYSQRKNIKQKLTPYLVDWKDLSDDIREYDRDAVRNLPAVLKIAGLQIRRRSR